MVDDDTTVAEVVVGYLQRAGHAVVSVADGPAALGAVRDAPPDLIVLDLMLPGIDGLEVCRRVRADHPDLPVIMLTALGEEEDRIAGLKSALTTTSPSRSPRGNWRYASTACCAAPGPAIRSGRSCAPVR